MLAQLDIFEIAGGDPIWIEAVGNLETAMTRVKELMVIWPSEYLIFNERTGEKISMTEAMVRPSRSAAL